MAETYRPRIKKSNPNQVKDRTGRAKGRRKTPAGFTARREALLQKLRSGCVGSGGLRVLGFLFGPIPVVAVIAVAVITVVVIAVLPARTRNLIQDGARQRSAR